MGIDVEAFETDEGGEIRGTRRAPNAEVARLFDEIADILEIKGDQPYRVNAYRVASRNVGNARESLDALFAAGRLREIPGVGEALEAKIVEFLSTGRMEFYEQLRGEFPSGLATLLQVPGLGPVRARAVYQELKITNLADLKEAALSGRLAAVTGFGEKQTQNVLEALDRMRGRTERNLLSTAWEVGDDYRALLQAANPGAETALVGSARRMLETTGNVDLLAAADEPGPLLTALLEAPSVVEVLERQAAYAAVLAYGGVQVRLWVVPRASWGSGLVWYTGSRAHVDLLRRRAETRGWRLSPTGLDDPARGKRLAGESEEGVYRELGLPFIPPELREADGEIEAAEQGALPRLVELEDIQGDLHCHTNWTDGAATLQEMAEAARAKGYQYMAVTDHSQSLTVARGLSPERVEEARRLVRRLNRKLAPFTILLGTEMDILRDGSLDYADDLLATLDYVSASVHSAFKQPREVMTARIIRAVEHPYVNTLNHPHGRLLRRREAYAVDMQAVVEAAARAGCALELNAQPDRLDLDGTWARRARVAGARFTISSDAHSRRNLDLMRYGVGSARRGWLTAADVLNTRPLEELKELLLRKSS